VAGKPLVEYVLARLPREIDELVLIVGGPHERLVRNYFQSAHGGRKVTYVRQAEQLGLGHAVQQAAPVIQGRFLSIMPDDIYAAEDLHALVQHGGLAALAMRVSHPENFGVLVCDAEGCLVKAVEKPKEFVSDVVSAGAYVLDQELFDVQVPPSARGEIGLPDLVSVLTRDRGRRVKVFEASFWLPVNDPEQLSSAEQEILRQGARQVLPDDSQVPET
jgi:glucose-1-phosphate thymidylyltransferase